MSDESAYQMLVRQNRERREHIREVEQRLQEAERQNRVLQDVIREAMHHIGRSLHMHANAALEEALTQPSESGGGERQVMPQVGGKSFRCECGCNVFTELSAYHYRCNSCGVEYKGEPEENPNTDASAQDRSEPLIDRAATAMNDNLTTGYSGARIMAERLHEAGFLCDPADRPQISIDDLVAEYKRDPEKRDAIERARERIQPSDASEALEQVITMIWHVRDGTMFASEAEEETRNTIRHHLSRSDRGQAPVPEGWLVYRDSETSARSLRVEAPGIAVAHIYARELEIPVDCSAELAEAIRKAIAAAPTPDDSAE